RRWAAAWARVRDIGTGEVAGWPLLYVESASRATEIVCAEPDRSTWVALLRHVAGDPVAMLTAASVKPQQYVAELPEGVRVDRDDESLMMLDHGGGPERRIGEVDVTGFDIDPDDQGDKMTIRLVRDGRVAAEGSVGLHGADAAYDMVETARMFRRHGLASWVMIELSRVATARGVSTGLLVATAEGAGLYRSLGWTHVAPMRSVMGVGPAAPRRSGQPVGNDCTSTNTSSWVGSATM
ncbi:MAG: hypothetical protein M3Y66_01360, partial [Actinomycetota bacterium]|nr:hypothetical protein [Actinomycetota bacterium]